MQRWTIMAALLGALLAATPAQAADSPVQITLTPDAHNPAHPKMGDWLKLHSIVTNTGHQPLAGLVVWLSLIEVDPGREQPVDLEDWSAHKAVVRTVLEPGAQFSVEWPLRLIQAGDYRVVVSAAERSASTLLASPFADFHVERIPTIESVRIVPVAAGVPLLLAAFAGWRLRRRRGRAPGDRD